MCVVLIGHQQEGHRTQHHTHQRSSRLQASMTMLPDVGGVGVYDVRYDECSRTTDFATAPGRLDIAQSKQHTLFTPPSHHLTTLSLGYADVGSVGVYGVGYDECSRTTEFVTAPVCQDIACVSDAIVPPAHNQSKQHTLSTPPSHHPATLSLRPADVGSIGCYDVGYNECCFDWL